jgi:putative SOS response-associated peptidase YedK
MCYSALVEASYQEYCRQFGLLFDRDGFHDLFSMRIRVPQLRIPDGLTHQLASEDSAFGRSIAQLHAQFLAGERLRISLEIEVVGAAIEALEAKKAGKSRDKDLGAKLRKREKLITSLEQSAAPGMTYRIYPNYFAAAIAEINGQRLLTPMRYRILPRNGVEVPPQYNVYNARRDSLQTAKNWKPLFGQQHALFPFTRFYEWVSRDGKPVEISFSPEGYSGMWAASLYEECPTEFGLIRSFAMVTDEPPEEVAAAGHDRCPVFLESSLLDQWLRPAGQSLEALQSLLDHKEKPHYSHALAA